MSIQPAAKRWSDYSAEERELHYNPRLACPNLEAYDAARADENQASLAWPGRKADIAYGDGPLRDLDIYVPDTGTAPYPVHIYIHGGYWRARDKKDFGFVGAALAKQGLLTVVINYPLCPVVTLDEVVAGSRDAFEWVVRNIADHGGDPSRITLSGHSAGGHLGAAVLAEDWRARGLNPAAQPLKGAVLISGIYDPAPTGHIAVNSEIGITPELAERHKYAAHPPQLSCPVHVMVGAAEPEGWIGQSEDYAAHLEKAGLPVSYAACDGENHFSILDQYRDSGSAISSAIRSAAGV